MSEARTPTLPTADELDAIGGLLMGAYDKLEAVVGRLSAVTNHHEPPPVTLADVGRLLLLVNEVRSLDLAQIADRLDEIERCALVDLSNLARFGDLQGSVPQLRVPTIAKAP